MQRPRERNAKTAKQATAKSCRLTANAVDRSIGRLPSQIGEEWDRCMEPRLCDRSVDIAVGIGFAVECAADEMVAGAHNESSRNSRGERAELAVLDGDHLAVEDVHAAVIPKAAEERAVPFRVHTPRIAHLGAVGEAFFNAEGVNIANDAGQIG